MGEGIFLLFLTPAAPDYHILHSEPKKHHSAMLQLGRLPSPARERTGGTQRGAGVCMRGCKRASACTRGPWGMASFSPSRCGTAACIPLDGAERSPAACKRVCFSSPAPNSIRNNCIWECGGGFWLGLGFFFCLLLKKLGWQFAYCYPACCSSSQPGQDPKNGHRQQNLSIEFSQPQTNNLAWKGSDWRACIPHEINPNFDERMQSG